MVQLFAMFVATCFGLTVALGYGYLFQGDFGDKVTFAQVCRTLECCILFAVCACWAGQRTYELFGATREAQITRDELITGQYVPLMHATGGFLLLSFVVCAALGRPIRLLDAVTFAISLALFAAREKTEETGADSLPGESDVPPVC